MRRLLWVGVGAGLGICGYRRASRVVRELTGSAHRPGRGPRRPGLPQLRGVAGFVRDVREGMELYAERQRLSVEPRRSPQAPTLGWQPVDEAGASRNGTSAR
jgi:hypothetical protein